MNKAEETNGMNGNGVGGCMMLNLKKMNILIDIRQIDRLVFKKMIAAC